MTPSLAAVCVLVECLDRREIERVRASRVRLARILVAFVDQVDVKPDRIGLLKPAIGNEGEVGGARSRRCRTP